MSDFLGLPWSQKPNAPQIPLFLYLAEKESSAGLLIGTILYGTLTPCIRLSVLTLPVRPTILGVVIALFSQCIGVLPYPATAPIPPGGA